MYSNFSNTGDDTLNWSHSLPVTHTPMLRALLSRWITFQNTEKVAKLWLGLNTHWEHFRVIWNIDQIHKKGRIYIKNKFQTMRSSSEQMKKRKSLGEQKSSFYSSSLPKLRVVSSQFSPSTGTNDPTCSILCGTLLLIWSSRSLD